MSAVKTYREVFKYKGLFELKNAESIKKFIPVSKETLSNVSYSSPYSVRTLLLQHVEHCKSRWSCSIQNKAKHSSHKGIQLPSIAELWLDNFICWMISLTIKPILHSPNIVECWMMFYICPHILFLFLCVWWEPDFCKFIFLENDDYDSPSKFYVF